MGRHLIKIDCGLSYVPLCKCGWRGSACESQLGADTVADSHRRTSHPAAYRDTVKKRRRRERQAV